MGQPEHISSVLPRAFEELGCSLDDEASWLALRRSGVGASEIAVVLGASEWESLLELYYRKLPDAEPENDTERDGDEWLLWGRLLEDSIRAELCKRAGVKLTKRGVLYRSTVHPWALATPDGVTEALEPVETKNLAFGYDSEEWAVSIPEKYLLQCQQQMLVLGADRCLFGALLWGSRLIWEWVPRDERQIARIVAGGEKFWGHVQRQEPPLSDGHPGARRLLGKRATVANAVELFDQEIADDLRVWKDSDAKLSEARALVKKLTRHRDEAADHIAQKMGAYRHGHTATGWQFRWETQRRRGYTVEATEFEQFKITPPKY